MMEQFEIMRNNHVSHMKYIYIYIYATIERILKKKVMILIQYIFYIYIYILITIQKLLIKKAEKVHRNT